MGAPAYELSEDAALTVLLHASKHPSCAVSGALFGRPRASGGGGGGAGYEIVVAAPLFHRSHVMAPCVEAALTQAEAAARQRGLTLAGWYHADYRPSAELVPHARRIADRIAERSPGACALVLDDAKLAAFTGAAAAAAAASASPAAGAGPSPDGGSGGAGGIDPPAPLDLLLRDPSAAPTGGAKGAGGWRRAAPSAGGGGLAAGGGGWRAVRERYLALFAAGRHRAVADFDDHLDDVAKDWLNAGLLLDGGGGGGGALSR